MTEPLTRQPLWALRVRTQEAIRDLPTATWTPTTYAGTMGVLKPGLRVVVDKPMRRVVVDWVGSTGDGADPAEFLELALGRLHAARLTAYTSPRSPREIHVRSL